MNSWLRRDSGRTAVPSTTLTALTVLAAALGLALGACSDDETSNGTPDASGDTGTDTTDTGAGDTAGATWAPTLYRVEALIIEQPASLGPLIGQLVSRDINDGVLNILIETRQFAADSGATTFEIRGGAGETADGTAYSLIADVPFVPATVGADGAFENTELLTLDFPVLLRLPPDCGETACPEDGCRNDDDCVGEYTCDLEGDGECLQNIVLPLKNIRITGTLGENDEGEPALQLASLEGAILRADADQLEVGLPGADPLLLTDLLGEQRMNYPDRDNPTGWQLSALINAVAVTPAE